jgi:hypothetical protein
MTPFVTAGAGFLLAVLWFDLMHDMLAFRAPDADALGTIARYYRRVTTDARPMNRLVSVVMLGTIAAAVAQTVRGDAPRWVGVATIVLVAAPVSLAVTHTFPAAVALGATGADASRARSILRDHLLCLGAIVSVLVVQLGFAR